MIILPFTGSNTNHTKDIPHGAFLAAPPYGIVDQAITDFQQSDLSEKMKALLVIAGKVQQGGRCVEEADVALARAAGADDKAIHDTVLTAAAFCMFNRYVDGLATWAPEDPDMYEQAGTLRAEKGYLYVKRSDS